MKPVQLTIGVIVIGIAGSLFGDSFAHAGGVNGPTSTTVSIPSRQSAYFDVPFVAGQPAIITIAGTANADLELFIYDASNQIFVGQGNADNRTATINMIRGGTLRVHVRNPSGRDNTFVLNTN